MKSFKIRFVITLCTAVCLSSAFSAALFGGPHITVRKMLLIDGCAIFVIVGAALGTEWLMRGDD